jgi:hypothetical protein
MLMLRFLAPPTHAVAALFCVLILGVGSIAPGAQAQSDITVTAETNRTEVGTEQAVVFKIRVRGVSPSAVETPEPPPTTNLVLNNATPNTNRSLSFGSGKMGRSVSFEWMYRPMRPGIARLRATDVVVDGKTYQTEEIRVRIVPQSEAPATSKPASRTTGSTDSSSPDADTGSAKPGPPESSLDASDLFIRVKTSTDAVYQNEQATVEYQLYFRPGVQPRHSRLASAWDANGFWREELDVASRPVPRLQRVNGDLYQTIVLKRVAVFPTRTGRLRIDPLQIETEAYASRSASSRNYSAQHRYEPVTLSSDPLTLDVSPLPDRAPPSFDGAVGQFSINAGVTTQTARVGGAVTYRVTVEGAGNIATLQAPTIDAPNAFDVYDPKIKTNLDRGGSKIRGTKTFTYILVPQSNGRFTLPAVAFAYFDPDTQRYDQIRTSPIPVEVTGDAAPTALSTTGAGLPVGDIAGLMSTAEWVSTDRTPMHRKVWPYAALALPLLAAVGIFALRRPTRETAPPAIETAAQRLDQAHALIQSPGRTPEQTRQIYGLLEKAVLEFIGDRTGHPVSGFSRDRLDTFLQNEGVDADHRTALRSLLDACDQAQFAPQSSLSDSLDVAHYRAKTLIRRFDRIFGDEA